MGFANIQQIDECISDYDGDNVSRLAWGSRQGQVFRFETLLLAGMGEQWIKRHTYGDEEWFRHMWLRKLDQLRGGGIKVGSYAPSGGKKILD
ncbi:MAG: hypothetical protein WB643_06400 [Candidatus Bathyarchaeia archaeon]